MLDVSVKLEVSVELTNAAAAQVRAALESLVQSTVQTLPPFATLVYRINCCCALLTAINSWMRRDAEGAAKAPRISARPAGAPGGDGGAVHVHGVLRGVLLQQVQVAAHCVQLGVQRRHVRARPRPARQAEASEMAGSSKVSSVQPQVSAALLMVATMCCQSKAERSGASCHSSRYLKSGCSRWLYAHVARHRDSTVQGTPARMTLLYTVEPQKHRWSNAHRSSCAFLISLPSVVMEKATTRQSSRSNTTGRRHVASSCWHNAGACRVAQKAHQPHRVS